MLTTKSPMHLQLGFFCIQQTADTKKAQKLCLYQDAKRLKLN